MCHSMLAAEHALTPRYHSAGHSNSRRLSMVRAGSIGCSCFGPLKKFIQLGVDFHSRQVTWLNFDRSIDTRKSRRSSMHWIHAIMIGWLDTKFSQFNINHTMDHKAMIICIRTLDKILQRYKKSLKSWNSYSKLFSVESTSTQIIASMSHFEADNCGLERYHKP